MVRGWLRTGCRRRALLLGAALLLGGAMWPRSPALLHYSEHFPHLSSAALAHYLADFTNHANMYPHLKSWSIENEWSNYTSWRYEVTYTCGVRCRGRAALSAHDAQHAHDAPHAPHVPQHGAARRHRLHALDTRCSHLPLLPWPALCEETETETLIVEEEGGARLQERVRAACPALAALVARCPDEAALRAARHTHLRALRAALASATARR